MVRAVKFIINTTSNFRIHFSQRFGVNIDMSISDYFFALEILGIVILAIFSTTFWENVALFLDGMACFKRSIPKILHFSLNLENV